MYKQNSEYKAIQKKLVAAVAMVLVACIMVVSSSYAWFTLSTAPEVTGIKTSVGSNGNLEMALRELADLTQIKDATGGETTVEANVTWGNLVDLSDSSYHLSEVSLAPAQLNIVFDSSSSVYKTYTDTGVESVDGLEVGDEYKDGAITAITEEDGGTWSITYKVLMKSVYTLGSSGAYLRTPVYGTDGRLASLSSDKVVTGPYRNEANGFIDDDDAFGVRAVGTSSNMTPAQMALRTAKLAVNSAISTSKGSAITSLREDSVKLAGMLVNIQMKNPNDPANYAFTDTDKQDVQTTIDHLNAIVVNLEDALVQAVYAVSVAQGANLTLDQIEIGNNIITAPGVDWTDLAALEATIKESGKTLAAMKSTLESAQTNLTNGSVYSALGALLSTNDFTIIDSATGTPYEVAEMVEMINGDGLFTAAKILMSTPTIAIKGGIYYEIAQFSGNYSGTAQLAVDVEYNGIRLDKSNPVDVIMATNATEPTIEYGTDLSVSGYYLNVVSTRLSDVTVTETEGVDSYTTITDIYGYAIDLAFRTNAAGSSLLLQTEAANRVEDSEQTQGAGSFMQFTSANDDFTLEQVINLMKSVRVVFIGDDGIVYGVAAMGVKLQDVVDNSGARVLYDEDTHQFYEEVTVDNVTTKYARELVGGTLVEGADGKTYVKAPLNLYGFTISDKGVMTLGEQMASNTLTELQQNTALGITSLVYLDGDTVTNADVAINGNSMTGTMNLQFASDAELDPMDYTFPDGTGEEEEEDLPMPAITAATIDATGKLTFTHENAPTGVIYTLAIGESNTYTVNNGDTLSAEQLALLAGNTVGLVATADGYEAGAAQVTVEYTAST